MIGVSKIMNRLFPRSQNRPDYMIFFQVFCVSFFLSVVFSIYFLHKSLDGVGFLGEYSGYRATILIYLFGLLLTSIITFIFFVYRLFLSVDIKAYSFPDAADIDYGIGKFFLLRTRLRTFLFLAFILWVAPFLLVFFDLSMENALSFYIFLLAYPIFYSFMSYISFVALSFLLSRK